ncbi:MAG: type II toxin-antitoxin system VapC family toxin [Candidatus Limnocylindrales bacterium]
MTTYVDTSVLYALLDDDDAMHSLADDTFRFLVNGEELITSNYVVLESAAIVQHRLGSEATRDLFDRLLPLIAVAWVDERLHATAVTSLLAASSRRVSLVDWTSFAFMRSRAIDKAFTFDGDFVAQGFEVVPQSQDVASST